MRLAEVDGKALLRRHGIAVPQSVLLRPGENPPDETTGWPGFLLKAAWSAVSTRPPASATPAD